MNYQIQMHFLKNVHFVKALLFVIMIKMRKRKSMINSNKKEHFLFSDFICIQCSNKYTDNVLDGAMTHNSLELEKIVCSYKNSITDSNPPIATPENCNLPINCNFFLQPNQAYYKSG